MRRRLIVSVISFIIFSSFTGSAFGEEIISIDKIQWGNQTVVNIFVTVEKDDAHINDSIMVSSGIIIGFVGFSSIIQLRNHKYVEEQKKIVYAIGLIIAVIASLHLIVMLSVYHNALEGYFYTVTIISTIGGFGFLVILILVQIQWNKSVETSTHKMTADYETVLKHIEESEDSMKGINEKDVEKNNGGAAPI